ncbi:MAG: tRNA-intron lyase [Candidatus Micrarchaeaceae archaeon]
MIRLKLTSKGTSVPLDEETKGVLRNGFFGHYINGDISLNIEETLYLIETRNAECYYKGKKATFDEVASNFWSKPKFMARYFTYKDWRDRGLIAKDARYEYLNSRITPVKVYNSSPSIKLDYSFLGTFYKGDLMCIIKDIEEGKRIYEELWIGQYGAYKSIGRGYLNKLDIYETLFLMEKNVLKLENISEEELKRYIKKKRPEIFDLYEVYKDWREKGYVVKTGFKFGTHFRIYMHGAKPMKEGSKERMHSKHVIHVFPKDKKLLISEWARAIRVAHSVRKTFILAMPNRKNSKKMKIDFILYHRKGGEAENPEKGAPSFGMLSLGEEEYIGGRELSGAIEEAKKRKLDLLLAIADRETSVTYYKVREIRLEGSDNEYYEIDWLQP